MSLSGNIDADNSWSFAATRDRGIDHFRFDFVRLATARLGKGGSFRCARQTLGFMTLFFDDAHPSTPQSQQRKSVEKHGEKG